MQAVSVNPEISAVPSTSSTFGQARTQPGQQSFYSVQDQLISQYKSQQSSLTMQHQQTGQQSKHQPPSNLQEQQKPQKPSASNSNGSVASQGFEDPHLGSFGRQNIPGGSVEFAQARPLLQAQQKMQSSLESSSQATRNEFNVRDSLDWTPTTSTISASMDFSGQPPSARMNFGGDNEDNFDMSSTSGMTTSSTTGASRSMAERKAPDQWSSGAGYTSNHPVRESSLEGMGGVHGRPQKDAAPQPPRQPSLTNSFENRSSDTFGESSGSGISMTSTDIFDPSTHFLHSQTQNKPSSTMSSFQGQTQGKDVGSSIKFDSQV